MTLKTALVTVLLWAVTFACIGAAIGAVLGMIVPGYYRLVFRIGQSADFSPVQVGIGLGVTQGLAAGAVLSIVVLALFALRDARSARSQAEGDGSTKAPRPRKWSVHVLRAVATALSLLLVGGATFVIGAMVGQQQIYHSLTERKLNKIASILETREFPNVEADYCSAAQVYLTGTVADAEARDELHKRLVAAFGSLEAAQMVRRVEVAQ